MSVRKRALSERKKNRHLLASSTRTKTREKGKGAFAHHPLLCHLLHFRRGKISGERSDLGKKKKMSLAEREVKGQASAQGGVQILGGGREFHKKGEESTKNANRSSRRCWGEVSF